MRRVIIPVLVFALLSVAPATSIAGPNMANGADRVPAGLRREWIQWAFGSSVNPLMQEDFCGQQVGDTFFLTLTGGAPDDRRIQCEIPAGVPVLAPPGGVISWAPTDGETDSELFATTMRQLEGLIFESVRVKLDGESISPGRLFISNPFDLSLEPGNLIQTVDPNVTGDSTRVMFGYWFVYIPELSPGEHRLVTADRFKGVGLFRTVFKIDATSGS